ncbi:acyl-CoA thioesterase [Roseospira visakhapatnamensis]|uniref:Acyl-CoA thioester hydrolase n=1 Tax=Roseospira visakhapatnamensis TaxID=390880 RepID=A0A7W6WAX5_9PROT|nr:thioesterase family protein [Roseospira visakhapatnamensis]MBB4267665.1 acyl-CoA thioester hydrolase [Roseospira visakhapatnamensis]
MSSIEFRFARARLSRADDPPGCGPSPRPQPESRDSGGRLRASYRFWTRDLVRFQDLDRLGHVNNVSFAIYLESGRVDLLETLKPGSTVGRGIGWVIARLELDFVGEAHYPAEVDIGSRILRLGRSSCVIGQGLFIGSRCFGEAQNVCVWFDTTKGKSLPMPMDVRDALGAYMQEDPVGL